MLMPMGVLQITWSTHSDRRGVCDLHTRGGSQRGSRDFFKRLTSSGQTSQESFILRNISAAVGRFALPSASMGLMTSSNDGAVAESMPATFISLSAMETCSIFGLKRSSPSPLKKDAVIL